MNEFDSRDDRTESGRGRDARSGVVRLGINVGIGSLSDVLGGVLGASGTLNRGRGKWQSVDDTDGSEREDPPRTSGTSTSTDVADDFLVDAHRSGDEFVVTAELPGISEEELSVGIDVRSNDLVVGADGQTIERVSLPWSSTDAAKVWFNNGVLEVRLRPDEDEEGRDG